MAELVSYEDLKIGQTIIFDSLSPKDTVTRKVLITGLVDYNVARMLRDILPYYTDIQKMNPSIAPIETLRFITMKLYENEVLNNQFIFAFEWMEPSSIKILNVNKHVDIRIYEQISANEIIELLQSHGYLVQEIIE